MTGILKSDSDTVITFKNSTSCLIFLSHPYFGCGLYALVVYSATGLANFTTIKSASGVKEITTDGLNLIIKSNKDYHYCIFTQGFK